MAAHMRRAQCLQRGSSWIESRFLGLSNPPCNRGFYLWPSLAMGNLHPCICAAPARPAADAAATAETVPQAAVAVRRSAKSHTAAMIRRE